MIPPTRSTRASQKPSIGQTLLSLTPQGNPSQSPSLSPIPETTPSIKNFKGDADDIYDQGIPDNADQPPDQTPVPDAENEDPAIDDVPNLA